MPSSSSAWTSSSSTGEPLDALVLGVEHRVPEAVVVLHVGGMAGGKATALDRFCRCFERPSNAARARVVVENDDRAFGLTDVLRRSVRIGRLVVRARHHCNDPEGIPDRQALALALATWRDGVRPKIHYSTP